MPVPASRAGFTLLELLVALAVAAIVFAVGVTGVGGFVTERRAHDRAEALLRTLEIARSEAIRRGARVDVCPGTGRCSAGALPWEGGWAILPDDTRGVGTPLAVERASPGVTIRGNRPLADYVSYTSAGQARRFDGALQMGTFTVCATGQRVRKVVVASSGRARLERAAEVCP